MSRTLEDREQVAVASRAEYRAWLSANHAQPEGVWIAYYKQSDPRALGYDALVEEALCFGWIDSLPRKLDAARTMHYVSPRKPRSPWSRANKVRIEALRANGLMQPPGEMKIEAAHDDGSWWIYDEIEELVVPDDLAVALDAAGARAGWDATAPSMRKGTLWQIKSAVKPATRARRIAKAAAEAKTA